MNITKEGDLQFKTDLMLVLLECSLLLNRLPRQKYGSVLNKDSYELAFKLDKVIKYLENA